MDLTIRREHLVPALEAAARIIEARTVIPILGNVLLDAEADRLTVTASDLDITVAITIEAAVETPGTTTVRAAAFRQFASRAADAELRLTMAPDSRDVTLRAGRSRLSLPVLPAQDFPSGKRVTGPEIAIAGETLAAALAPVMHAVSTEETRYYLNGVHFEPPGDDGVMHLVSTDGLRLARTRLPVQHADGGAVVFSPLIIPTKTARELLRIAHAAGKDAVRITFGEQQIAIRCGNLVLTSKLIDGTFPEWRRGIPGRAEETFFLVERKALLAAIERVTIAAGDKPVLRWRLGEGALTLSCRDPDRGDADEPVTVPWDADPVEGSIQPRFLVDALGAVEGDAAEISMEVAATVLRSAGASDSPPALAVVAHVLK